jgi:hypothetical protein
VISTTKALVTAGLTIGLIAGGAGTAFAATPTTTGSTASIVSAETPHGNPPYPKPPHPGGLKPLGGPGKDGNWGGKGPDHNRDGNWGGKDNRGDNWGDRNRGDHNRDRDRDRGHRDHDRDWGVSPERCRDGGGHVNWHRDRCDGGRFDCDRIR